MKDLVFLSDHFRHKEVQQVSATSLEAFLESRQAEGRLIQRYMNAWPKFAQSVRIMEMMVGFDIHTNGMSLLGKAITDAVKAVSEGSPESGHSEALGKMMSRLVVSISQIANWEVVVERNGIEERWEICTEHFNDFLERMQTNQFLVRKAQVPATRTQLKGLQARLLCCIADDAQVGRMLEAL